MNTTVEPADRADQTLDSALARVLCAPMVPMALRVRVQASVAQNIDMRLPTSLGLLELEARERLAAFEAEYVRLRRRTLGTLLGAAFAAGILAAWLAPWLSRHLGSAAPFVLAVGGAAAGIAIVESYAHGRAHVLDLLRG